MLKRKVEKQLLLWKDSRKTALLVSGARQIGKSYSVSHFIEGNFKHVVSINFDERLDLIEPFVKIKSYDDLIVRLSIVAGTGLVKGETLIFLDEIQLLYKRREELAEKGSIFDYVDIVTLMKSAASKGDYRFILSGSLLGVTLNSVVLNPLGYMDKLTMHPLDFEEYLWAKGVGEEAISYLRGCFEGLRAVDEEINKQFLCYFREYVLIGGMPEAVQSFMENKNVALVSLIHAQIADEYSSDIVTYVKDKEKKLKIKDLFEAIPSELNAKNKRFVSSHVLDASYLKINPVSDDFLWLTNAGVAIPTYNVADPSSPLLLSCQRKTLKLFNNDVGLLSSSLLDEAGKAKLLMGESQLNYGAPYENAAAEELSAHGFGGNLFYFNSKKHGEVDFVVEYKNEVLPIEIKSGKPNQMLFYNHTALNNIMKTYPIAKAYVFGEGNLLKESGRIIQLPIYMLMFLTKGWGF